MNTHIYLHSNYWLDYILVKTSLALSLKDDLHSNYWLDYIPHP